MYRAIILLLRAHKSGNQTVRKTLRQTANQRNISRIDVALDDKPVDGNSGNLDLDTIIRKAEAHEYISTSRTKQTIREIVQYKGDNISGRTIYFGS